MTIVHIHMQGYMVTGVLMCAIGLENASSNELLRGHYTSAVSSFPG